MDLVDIIRYRHINEKKNIMVRVNTLGQGQLKANCRDNSYIFLFLLFIYL